MPPPQPGEREQGHEIALKPLDFLGRHHDRRATIDGIDHDDRLEESVLDEGGRPRSATRNRSEIAMPVSPPWSGPRTSVRTSSRSSSKDR